MRLFQKLLGGSPKLNVIDKEGLMPEDQFWEIIELSFNHADGHYEEQKRNLCSALCEKMPQDILLFSNRFKQLRENATSWTLWGAFNIIKGSCSDSIFSDFRDWTIAQGKDFYYKTVEDPDTLVELDKDKIELEWESIRYISLQLFEDITGEPIPQDFLEDEVDQTIELSEKSGDLKILLPNLWFKYSQVNKVI